LTFLRGSGGDSFWAFGASQIIHDKMSYGVLSAFLVYTYRFYTKLRSISWMVNVMQRTSNSARRIFEVLDHVLTVPEPTKPVPVGRLEGHLEIRNVGFNTGTARFCGT
jgi:ATP-binding cassette subfamily B protein